MFAFNPPGGPVPGWEPSERSDKERPEAAPPNTTGGKSSQTERCSAQLLAENSESDLITQSRGKTRPTYTCGWPCSLLICSCHLS